MDSLPRTTLLRGTAAVVLVALLVACAGLTLAYEPPQLGAGTIKDPADGTTVVAVQGFHFQGEGSQKKPARLLPSSTRPAGSRNWPTGPTPGPPGSTTSTRWRTATCFVTSTVPGDTLAYELNPETDERVWEQEFDAEDTHDVAMLNEHELLVANMRNTNDEGVANDRLFVYNLTTDEVVWGVVLQGPLPLSRWTAG